MDLSYSELALSVTDLKAEVAFFERLGFRVLPLKTNHSAPHNLLSDGELLIGLYEAEFSSPSVTLYCEDLQAEATRLAGEGIPLQQIPSKDGDGLDQATAKSPSGVTASLQPRSDLDYPERADQPTSRVGIFGELAIPVSDFDAEARFWNTLGFPIMGEVYEQPEKWAILGAKTLPIGLHETDRFADHALTFFSPEMGRTLGELKNEGIHLEWEGLDAEENLAHGVVKSPGGYTLYLFTGDLTKW